MHLLRRPDYVSDTDEFVEQLRRKDPTLEQRQLAGHAIYWSPQMPPRTTEQGYAKAGVPMQDYVYATTPKTAL